jgi:hypothetical protein
VKLNAAGVIEMQGNIIMRPWASARAEGRKGRAALLFFMQLSLVLWPAAVRVALRLEQERQKQVLLNQLAAIHAHTPQEAQHAPELSSAA